MKIAVDARELTGRQTGVGRYLAELMTRWTDSAEARRHEWVLYAHADPVRPEHFRCSVEVVPGNGGTRWEQWSFARALATARPDVLFAPGYTAPLTTPCPFALTVHDVSFFAHREWFSRREGGRRRLLTARSARHAAVVLTDSAFSRDEIVRHIRIPAQRIRVVPLGISRRPDRTAVAGADVSGRREPIILFVGSIFRRRHIDRLISAFVDSVAARVPGSRLEIVGENRTYPAMDLAPLVAASPADVQARVRLRSYIDEAALDDLYARASVFAFPSEYEGFGLTPLEALAAGVPAVVLDTPVARDIYGPAARYVNPDLSIAINLADALVDLLTSESARRAILTHASEVLARYDWNRTAAATLDALEGAARV